MLIFVSVGAACEAPVYAGPAYGRMAVQHVYDRRSTDRPRALGMVIAPQPPPATAQRTRERERDCRPRAMVGGAWLRPGRRERREGGRENGQPGCATREGRGSGSLRVLLAAAVSGVNKSTHNIRTCVVDVQRRRGLSCVCRAWPDAACCCLPAPVAPVVL